jgi:hypothetical protein
MRNKIRAGVQECTSYSFLYTYVVQGGKCHFKPWEFFELLVMSVVMNVLRIPEGQIITEPRAKYGC